MRDEFNTTGRNGPRDEPGASDRPTLRIDVDLYQAFLDGSDMSDAQKEEFLCTMWNYIVGFIELQYEVHPLQEVCGQNEKIGRRHPLGALDQLSSQDTDKDKPGDQPSQMARLEAE